MATDATVPAVAPGPNIVSSSKIRVWRASSRWARSLVTSDPASRSPASSKARIVNGVAAVAVFEIVKVCVSTPPSTGNRNVFDAGRSGPSTGSRSSS